MPTQPPDTYDDLEDTTGATTTQPCRCAGTGWVQVLPSYAEREVPVGANGERTASAMATARNTVYPCRVCRPAMFWRWHDGHLDVGHDRSACEECSTGVRRPRRGPGVFAGAVPPTPERTDLD